MGIKTNYVLQAMTQSGGSDNNNEVAMTLQGTSAKWSSGRHGILFNKAFHRENQLTLVALDEVDKCYLQDYLVTLLDPRQALQDSFWREFTPQIDMRSKVLFFATCNDVESIRQGGKSPLWSRLLPVEMPGYSVKESIEIVAQLAYERQREGLSMTEVYLITESVVERYAGQTLPSVRMLIDRVNRELYLKRFPVLQQSLGQRKEYKSVREIGFGA